MRDYLCNEEELKETVSFYEKTVAKRVEKINLLYEDIKNGIQRYPADNLENINGTKKDVFLYLRICIKAKYSLGLNCAEMEEQYLQALEVVYYEGYFKIMQYLCIGMLLEVPPEKLDAIVKVIDDEKVDDVLLDFLVNAYGLKRSMKSKKLEKEHPYKEFIELIDLAKTDKQKASEKLYEFVEKKWLKGIGLENAHKEKGYKGAWCYEAGVIAKIFNLDDSKLKDSNHYPYDLVHYKNGMNYIVTPIHYGEDSEEETDISANGIPENPELEQIIPGRLHDTVNQVISDYNNLSDEDFWKKYELNQIWYTLDEYTHDKDKYAEMLGMVLVNVLVDEGYILQLDWKENIDNHIDDIKNFWGKQKTKLAYFVLDNDQTYYAMIPEANSLTSMCGVKIGIGKGE